MPGKGPQDRVRLALGIHVPRQMAVQPLDGPGDGPDALLCAVLASPGVLAQKLQDLLPLPLRIRHCPLACQFVLLHCRKLVRLAAQVTDRFSIVQPKAALLDDAGRPGVWLTSNASAVA